MEKGCAARRTLDRFAWSATLASPLIDAGANPKAIQEFMGHSKIQATFGVYGHLVPGSRGEVSEGLTPIFAAGNNV